MRGAPAPCQPSKVIKMKSHTLALAAAAGILCLPIAAAHASQTTVTRTVAHDDLDLRTTRGQRALQRRVIVAAHAACGDASSLDPKGRRIVARCRAEVLSKTAPRRDALIAAARTEAPALAARRR